MSALNADAVNGPSEYLRSKGAGEQIALAAGEAGIAVTSFRPSVIFGPDDSFFNRFAVLLKVSPMLPLACPYARFAPVYVDNVTQAFEQTLADESVFGEGLEICGPKVYTLKELVEYTARLIARRRLIIGLPNIIARLQGRILQHVPGQPFTMDNFHSLQVDSVCRSDGLARLGIAPHSVEAIMPTFLSDRTREGRYRRFRRSAGRE
jgi:NADH dehydrogenase